MSEYPYSLDATADNRSAQVIMVESSKALPLVVTLCVLVGLSLGLSCWALSRADDAERQAVIAKMRTEGFTRALISKGIDPYPHIKGEDP